jgi:hypothetical protein
MWVRWRQDDAPAVLRGLIVEQLGKITAQQRERAAKRGCSKISFRM